MRSAARRGDGVETCPLTVTEKIPLIVLGPLLAAGHVKCADGVLTLASDLDAPAGILCAAWGIWAGGLVFIVSGWARRTTGYPATTPGSYRLRSSACHARGSDRARIRTSGNGNRPLAFALWRVRLSAGCLESRRSQSGRGGPAGARRGGLWRSWCQSRPVASDRPDRGA